MSAKKPEDKQVKKADKVKKTADEIAHDQAETAAAEELRDGYAWVTYTGLTPETAQTGVNVVGEGGRTLRFFRGIRKQVSKQFAALLVKGGAFSMEE